MTNTRYSQKNENEIENETETETDTETDTFLQVSEKDNYLLTVKNIGQEVLKYFTSKNNENKDINYDTIFYQIIAKSMEVIEIDNTKLHYIRKELTGAEKLQLCLDVIIDVLEKYDVLSNTNREYYKALVYSGLIQETISLIADVTKNKYKINYVDVSEQEDNQNSSPESDITSSSSSSSSSSFWKYMTLKNMKRIFLFSECCYKHKQHRKKEKKNK